MNHRDTEARRRTESDRSDLLNVGGKPAGRPRPRDAVDSRLEGFDRQAPGTFRSKPSSLKSRLRRACPASAAWRTEASSETVGRPFVAQTSCLRWCDDREFIARETRAQQTLHTDSIICCGCFSAGAGLIAMRRRDESTVRCSLRCLRVPGVFAVQPCDALCLCGESL